MTGGQFIFSATAAAPIVTTAGNSVPVVSIQSGGTLYFCNPQGVTVPTATGPISQPATTRISTASFPNFQQPTVPPPTSTTVTVNGLAQLLSAAKKTISLSGNWRHIMETHCNGMIELAWLGVPWTPHHFRMM